MIRFCVANTATKAAEKQNSKFEQRRPAENVTKIQKWLQLWNNCVIRLRVVKMTTAKAAK